MDSHVKSLTSVEAYEFLQKEPRAVLIDTRSNMEFLFIGHPIGAINIPWIDEPDSSPVVLICRSGKRSLEAGELLIKEGFTDVYNVLDGFEGELDDHHHRSTKGGWRFDGLPWEQC
jgi:rhodanese-related sulfurtransferase